MSKQCFKNIRSLIFPLSSSDWFGSYFVDSAETFQYVYDSVSWGPKSAPSLVVFYMTITPEPLSTVISFPADISVSFIMARFSCFQDISARCSFSVMGWGQRFTQRTGISRVLRRRSFQTRIAVPGQTPWRSVDPMIRHYDQNICLGSKILLESFNSRHLIFLDYI